MADEKPRYTTFCSYTVGGDSSSSSESREGNLVPYFCRQKDTHNQVCRKNNSHIAQHPVIPAHTNPSHQPTLHSSNTMGINQRNMKDNLTTYANQSRSFPQPQTHPLPNREVYNKNNPNVPRQYSQLHSQETDHKHLPSKSFSNYPPQRLTPNQPNQFGGQQAASSHSEYKSKNVTNNQERNVPFDRSLRSQNAAKELLDNNRGEYRVGIKFNDKHVPDSPYKVYVTPAMGEARKVEVTQMPEQGALINKAINFLILRNGAPYKGHIDCRVIAPSGAEDDCFMDRFDDDVHSVRFVPRENGVHNIHVKYEGIHIPGSPFRLRIGKDDADPAAVSVSGKGLEGAVSGQKMDFIVDTCSAGAGTLAVTIDGPSKVSMDCTEVENGYKVRYTPLTSGDYYIAVKYNGCHIAGSPYKVKCTGHKTLAEAGTVQESASVVVQTVEKTGHGKTQHGPAIPHFTSDASKITSKGLGLKKAHLNRANTFTISANTAGNNILYVGVYGPKAPCEEVTIKHTGYNNYQVNYMVKDRGDYLLIVKWGEDHIPGSPFHVPVQ